MQAALLPPDDDGGAPTHRCCGLIRARRAPPVREDIVPALLRLQRAKHAQLGMYVHMANEERLLAVAMEDEGKHDAALIHIALAREHDETHKEETRKYANMVRLVRAIEQARRNSSMAATLRHTVQDLDAILSEMPDVAAIMDDYAEAAERVDEDARFLSPPSTQQGELPAVMEMPSVPLTLPDAPTGRASKKKVSIKEEGF